MTVVYGEKSWAGSDRRDEARWRLPNWGRIVHALVGVLAQGWEFAARDMPGSELFFEGKRESGYELDRSAQPRHCVLSVDVASARIIRGVVDMPRADNSNSRTTMLRLLWVGAMGMSHTLRLSFRRLRTPRTITVSRSPQILSIQAVQAGAVRQQDPESFRRAIPMT